MLVPASHLIVRLTCSGNGSTVFAIQPHPSHENDTALMLLSGRSPIKDRHFHIAPSTVSVKTVRQLKITYQLRGRHSFFSRCVLSYQENPSILCKINVHCRIHKSPTTVTILSLINFIFPHPILDDHFNIILSLCTVLQSGLFPSGLPT